MCHAGAVNLGVDVADQVCLQVEVLDQRQRVVGVGLGGVVGENFDGVVAAERAFEAWLNSWSRMVARKMETEWK